MAMFGTMQALMVRLLQVLKLSMDNTSTLMQTEAKLRVVLLRMQMVLIASMMLQQVNAWLMSSSQQETTIGTISVLMVSQWLVKLKLVTILITLLKMVNK